MNDRQHEDLLDLVAVYALGALGPEEARIVSAHLATCPECRAEYNALRPAASAVGFAADNEALDADLQCRRMKRTILRAIGGDVRSARPSRPWAAIAAAVAAIAAALTLVFMSPILRERGADRRIVAELQASGAQRYVVPGGEILKTRTRLYLVMNALPPPPQGRVYQAWTLASGAKTVVPSITFVPDAHGFVVVSLPEPATGVAAVAISLEPPGGSKAPTTKPSFVRPLT